MIFFHMVVAVILLGEAFSTYITIKSASFMYDHHMFFIHIFPGESSPTFLTEIIIFPGVILHVTVEDSSLGECLLTKSAGNFPFCLAWKKECTALQCTGKSPIKLINPSIYFKMNFKMLWSNNLSRKLKMKILILKT